MERLQVQFTDEQLSALRAVATRRGASIASVVRDAVELFLRTGASPDRETRHRLSLRAVGAHRSGVGDLATAHDRHLADVYDRRD